MGHWVGVCVGGGVFSGPPFFAHGALGKGGGVTGVAGGRGSPRHILYPEGGGGGKPGGKGKIGLQFEGLYLKRWIRWGAVFGFKKLRYK